MLRERRSGGRAQNYFPIPVRYRVGAEGDDGDWAVRVVGLLFVVLGTLVLTGPLLRYLSASTRVLVGIFGAPIMVRGLPDVLWSLGSGGVLLLVGVGVIKKWLWAFPAGMLFTVAMVFTAGPILWAFGGLVLLVLGRGLWAAYRGDRS